MQKGKREDKIKGSVITNYDWYIAEIIAHLLACSPFGSPMYYVYKHDLSRVMFNCILKPGTLQTTFTNQSQVLKPVTCLYNNQ